ncbi:hypothetical protein GCM10011529_30380 [Polymorphobacter glacialis]|uniref:SDR family NAD(P)-dependent oxidoreductase n=1 Tax=Sandarakinorhabdus glacialis TaxID=1614636 RepID=A0A917ECY8_9SPHN|nr:hypothetical protein GCM10011529_30380 [Polymorphobacter glacialis]
MPGAPFEDFPESGWDKVMDLYLKSPFFLTQALHAALKASASLEWPAKVTNISSIDDMRLSRGETYSYHASKSALIYLTKRMAARLVRDAINVTSIAPGAFASEMNRPARDHGEAIAKAVPATASLYTVDATVRGQSPGQRRCSLWQGSLKPICRSGCGRFLGADKPCCSS